MPCDEHKKPDFRRWAVALYREISLQIKDETNLELIEKKLGEAYDSGVTNETCAQTARARS